MIMMVVSSHIPFSAQPCKVNTDISRSITCFPSSFEIPWSFAIPGGFLKRLEQLVDTRF